MDNFEDGWLEAAFEDRISGTGVYEEYQDDDPYATYYVCQVCGHEDYRDCEDDPEACEEQARRNEEKNGGRTGSRHSSSEGP